MARTGPRKLGPHNPLPTAARSLTRRARNESLIFAHLYQEPGCLLAGTPSTADAQDQTAVIQSGYQLHEPRAPSPCPTESAAPHPRRRPDTGEIFLDRVPGQGWPKATAKRRAKPVLDAVRDRETIKPRVGGETLKRSHGNFRAANRDQTKTRQKPHHRPQQQAVSSKHDRVARLDAPSP